MSRQSSLKGIKNPFLSDKNLTFIDSDNWWTKTTSDIQNLGSFVSLTNPLLTGTIVLIILLFTFIYLNKRKK
jgi:hypothetical protein